MGAEAEGSGLAWGSDFGSGSGDLVRSEELLRVSVKGELAWCLGGHLGGTHASGHRREPDGSPSIAVETDGGLLGGHDTSPSVIVCLGLYFPHQSALFCFKCILA